MSVQRYVTSSGKVRYRARVKHHGRAVTSRVFDRKRDADAWEQEQTRRLRLGEWIDPRRGRIELSSIVEDWLRSRGAVKRSTRESDESAWRLHIEPRFGNVPVGSLTSADIGRWTGDLAASGAAKSSVSRYLNTLRSLLNFAVADGRIRTNPAAGVKPPTGGQKRREGQFLSVRQLQDLATACAEPYGELVLVLGMAGLRWGELAGLQVGDIVDVPGRGLRLDRAVLASRASGEAYVDTLKGHRSRTVPLVAAVVPIVDRWAADKSATSWLFDAPGGGPLSEANWKRSVDWTRAITAIARPGLHVHDLRHTAASVWLAAGADPKVVQRILGHASAAMTMDLYGHLANENLWVAARRVDAASETPGDTLGTREPPDIGPAESDDASIRR